MSPAFFVRGSYSLVFSVALAIAAGATVRIAKAQDATPIRVDVDASEASRHILHSRLTIPTKPGPLTLYYPKWIPGEHGPTGPITDVAGLHFSAGGKAIPWQRDDEDMFAFHCEVPDGADSVEVVFDFLSPPSNTGGFSAGASSSAHLAVLNWNQVLLYPAGKPATEITLKASLNVPEGWSFATALPLDSKSGTRGEFKAASLVTLIDSPLLCGLDQVEIPLGLGDGRPHFLDLACDSKEGLEIKPQSKEGCAHLVAEAGALFGARHYDDYHFLLALSDHIAHFGLEHHASSDNRLPERSLLESSRLVAFGHLLSHEYVHSWNGKYRRPADMITENYQQPQHTKLLWVYEGLTDYLGTILAARSGLWTPEQTRDYLATIADAQRNQTGRSWRPLADTTVAAQLLFASRRDWGSWRRGTDFYPEGVLIWLEVDTLIRSQTKGERSLDDFCQRFHGGKNTGAEVKPYTFEDVVSTLNDVTPYDWADLLRRRTEATADDAPLAGFEQGGWKLTYSDEPNEVQETLVSQQGGASLASSIGLSVGREGYVQDVVVGKAAEKAGLGPGMRVIAVNGRRFSPERINEAVKATNSNGPLVLLVENGDYFSNHTLDYHDGAKYPSLTRIDGSEDYLSAILKARLPSKEKEDEEKK